MTSKIIRKRPQVAPDFTTTDSIIDYYNILYRNKNLKNRINELIQETRKEYSSDRYCCMMLNEMSKEHIIKKDKYFDEYIELLENEIRTLKDYIITPKVKGQINSAKFRIQCLKQEIKNQESKQDYWGIPT